MDSQSWAEDKAIAWLRESVSELSALLSEMSADLECDFSYYQRGTRIYGTMKAALSYLERRDHGTSEKGSRPVLIRAAAPTV